jgi:hypothetical protein
MTNRSSRGSEQPAKAVALRRSINDGELIRELHQGQRSCGPHYKAEHMAAPDQSVKTPRALLPRRRRPHTAFREVDRLYATPEAVRKFSWASPGEEE